MRARLHSHMRPTPPTGLGLFSLDNDWQKLTVCVGGGTARWRWMGGKQLAKTGGARGQRPGTVTGKVLALAWFQPPPRTAPSSPAACLRTTNTTSRNLGKHNQH